MPDTLFAHLVVIGAGSVLILSVLLRLARGLSTWKS